MVNYSLKAANTIILITPTALALYGKDYYKAAVNWATEGTYSPVPYFLFCRSIELGLKAFSLSRGETIKCVEKDIRHNLLKAITNARKHGLDSYWQHSKEEYVELQKANDYYCKKEFEYFDISLITLDKLPDLQVLKQIALKALSLQL